MATGDHRLLHVHAIDKQLTDSPAIAVRGDAKQAHGLADHHGPEMVASCSGSLWLGPASFQLWCINARKPDPLTISRSAGIAVIAITNDHGLLCANRRCHPQQHESDSLDHGEAQCHHTCPTSEAEYVVITLECCPEEQ